MKITIDIPNPPSEQKIIDVPIHFCGGKVVDVGGYGFEERKTGKWFDNVDKYDKRAQKHDYFCLECKTHAMDFVGGSEDWWCCKPPKYCPNCGTKMEVADEGND